MEDVGTVGISISTSLKLPDIKLYSIYKAAQSVARTKAKVNITTWHSFVPLQLCSKTKKVFEKINEN